MNAHLSRNKNYRRWQWLAALTLLALAALPIWGHDRGKADDDDDNKNSPTPPGLYITPTALPHALQKSTAESCAGSFIHSIGWLHDRNAARPPPL